MFPDLGEIRSGRPPERRVYAGRPSAVRTSGDGSSRCRSKWAPCVPTHFFGAWVSSENSGMRRTQTGTRKRVHRETRAPAIARRPRLRLPSTGPQGHARAVGLFGLPTRLIPGTNTHATSLILILQNVTNTGEKDERGEGAGEVPVQLLRPSRRHR